MSNEANKIPVVILCGGAGTRLKEETEFKPKPIIKIGNRPILWHIMKIYSHYGFNDFILCLGYKGEIIKEYFIEHKWLSQDFSLDLDSQRITYLNDNFKENWRIILADTGLETLTAGRLYGVKKYLEGVDRFMLTYGDGLANLNIPKLIEFHQNSGKIATITGAHPSSKYGLVEANADKLITSFRQKPSLEDYVNIGFMVFEKKIFDYLGQDGMIEDVFIDLARDKQLVMYQHDGFFHAMDTYRDYEDLNKMWQEGKHPWEIWST
jgi:glucose-1-phosphate cytidylyltransferase